MAKRIVHDKSAARKSQAWFAEQVKYLGDMSSPNAVMANSGRRRNFLIPGQMTMFFYSAKYKDELPYYDTFPLVLPFSQDEETFTGINFHYLPVKFRVVLLKNLLDFSTDKKLDETSKIKMQWRFVAGVARYQGVEAAVKKYRFDHVQSQFLFVPAPQWFNAVMLPFERFVVGTNNSRVDKKYVWRNISAT
jgi:hypothetical protein